MLTSVVRLNSRVPEVRQQGQNFASDFVQVMAEEVALQAMENVAPGKGPGPHPHRLGSNHIDTGDLMNSIRASYSRRGFMHEAFVETDLDYGIYLEVGWTTVAGTHYRYPWLGPAAQMKSREWEPIARTTSDRWFTQGGPPAIRIRAPLSSTLFPEMR